MEAQLEQDERERFNALANLQATNLLGQILLKDRKPDSGPDQRITLSFVALSNIKTDTSYDYDYNETIESSKKPSFSQVTIGDESLQNQSSDEDDNFKLLN